MATSEDRVKVIDGATYLDGERVTEVYARTHKSCGICDLPREVRVQRGHLFLMGDNREVSIDSREWGPVPQRRIVGKVVGPGAS